MRIAVFCLVTFVSSHTLCFAEPVYYRSDSVGLELEIINKFRIDEFEYVLKVDKTPRKIEKKLYRKMKEYRKWETCFDEQGKKTELKEYEDTKIIFRTEYDRKGNRKYEELFSAGILQEKKYYSYSSRGIDHVDTFNAADKKLYTDEYEISPFGRLRAIRRMYPDNSMRLRHYTYSGSRLVEEWEYVDNRIYILVYNEQENILRRETWEKDQLISVTDVAYDSSNRKIVRETEKDIENNITKVRTYDNNGDLEKESIDTGEGFPSDTQYTYKDGRVVGIRKKSEIGVEEWKYFFDGSGKLAKEEYYRRGFLEMRTVYTDEETWYEEILRNEEVFVRVYYENSKKVREEFVQDGNVIRTREFD